MIDTRRTLVNLHEKFPNLSLDNLFEILDCYIEMPSMWTNTDKTFTWPFTNVKYGNPTCTTATSFEVPKKCD
jgi:hypothetical protein